MEVISRDVAVLKGLRHYFTGTPCSRGHVSERFVSIRKCKECCREDSMKRHKHTTSKRRAYNNLTSFIETANRVHNNLYTYSEAEYIGAHTVLNINCHKHGVFPQTPTNHVSNKRGCPLCASERVGLLSRGTTLDFIKLATKVWGEVFDYSETDYVKAHKKVRIKCQKHGVFTQTPTNHLSGKQGCSKCNHMKSEGEMQVLAFASFLTSAESRVKPFKNRKELDIYLPEHNVAIEYCGEYHHGTKDKDDEAKNKRNHINKHKECAEQGVRLITMFEGEWKDRNRQVKCLLRSAIGKLKGRLFARKCSLRKVDTKEARGFFENYHIQGGSGNGEHYGLYWKEKLVACMRFTFGGNDRGASATNRVWTLSRYATRVNVVGGASRLFSAFVNEHKPKEVKSFSDNRYFSGGMYEKLGFLLDADLPEDYQVWSPKLGVLPKPHYQRRNIPKRLEEHGVRDDFDPATDPRTEADMTYLMGCRRLYDCGKKRWLWVDTTHQPC
jgi:hypothetical protein